MLQARGIQCELSQESLGWIYGIELGPLGKVDLLAPSSQAKKARQVLREFTKEK